jgi:quercetin dioxygenase-like cupin family protein
MNKAFTRSAILALFLLVTYRAATPQQTAQSQRFPQFENEDVSVWKTIVAPNAPLTMHTHQHPRVIIALSGGVMKVVNEDGTSEMHPWDTGKAYWLPASEGIKRHADQNQGKEPIEVMVVELKKAY